MKNQRAYQAAGMVLVCGMLSAFPAAAEDSVFVELHRLSAENGHLVRRLDVEFEAFRDVPGSLVVRQGETSWYITWNYRGNHAADQVGIESANLNLTILQRPHNYPWRPMPNVRPETDPPIRNVPLAGIYREIVFLANLKKKEERSYNRVRSKRDIMPEIIASLEKQDETFLDAAFLAGWRGQDAKAAIPGLIAGLDCREVQVMQLKTEPERIRSMAAYALGEIGITAKDAVPKLIERLTTDEHANVRWHAAIALGKMNEAAESALEALRSEREAAESEVYREHLSEAMERIEKAVALAAEREAARPPE